MQEGAESRSLEPEQEPAASEQVLDGDIMQALSDGRMGEQLAGATAQLQERE